MSPANAPLRWVFGALENKANTNAVPKVKIKWTRRESNSRPQQLLQSFIWLYPLTPGFLTRAGIVSHYGRAGHYASTSCLEELAATLGFGSQGALLPWSLLQSSNGSDGAQEAHAAQLCENGLVLGTFELSLF